MGGSHGSSGSADEPQMPRGGVRRRVSLVVVALAVVLLPLAGHFTYAALVSSVRGRIDGAKRYPRLARRAGFEGRALLIFKILRDGRVAEIRVLESSGFDMLDEAAVRAVERAAPFPEEARQIRGDYIEVILPLVFQLR